MAKPEGKGKAKARARAAGARPRPASPPPATLLKPKERVAPADHQGAEEEEEEEDEVLMELDVCVSSKPPSTTLSLMQYPMQPKRRPMNGITGARVKPVHNLLEVWRPIDRGMHYDDSTEESLQLDKVTHAGHIVPAVTNYALGVVSDGALHLTPLDTIMQMRATFTHMVKPESDDKTDDTVADEGTTEELQQVVFKKKESDRAQSLRRNSYAYKVSQEEMEAWVDLEVHPASSDYSEAARESMLCSNPNEVYFGGDQGRILYSRRLKHLQAEEGVGSAAIRPIDLTQDVPPEEEEITVRSSAASGAPMRHMVGVESLLGYVYVAGVISHDMLKRVSGVDDDAAIIEKLQDHAHLLRGNWVVPSKELFAGKEKLIFARDAAMTTLQLHGAIDRKLLQEDLDVAPAAFRNVLEGICEFREVSVGRKVTAGLWVPKLRDCVKFASLHPREALRAENWWNKLRAKITAALGKPLPAPPCPSISFRDEAGLKHAPAHSGSKENPSYSKREDAGAGRKGRERSEARDVSSAKVKSSKSKSRVASSDRK